ncbi:hypothetical protein SAMN05444372_10159 [Flavobacterium micromati]|uniref:Uncharacterized protein n=1 Tax=Flavobacterium micromati TaxID=229205 RepID=A0A1M5FDA0_9FLAO|nr:hypothetical protein [Flavobacterium micromati]MCL6461988.1 hypothetical protein [Flavobacterium micromati]SHF89051.1 hypothetical protein SAMN05444372_10159 [Flavobacterium micromati]
MNATNFFVRPFRRFKNFTSRSNSKEISQESNKLIHPRFEISKNDDLQQKIVSSSLLFLMYSEENDALFI